MVAVAPATVVAQTGGYGDVPEDAFYSTPVSDLASESVFDGTECEAGFCPGEAIDRKTMAVWIVRVLDGADPSAVTRTRFNDVDVGSFYAPFIERMAELGVTRGCGDGSGFCPEATVIRAQMAVFISRAYDLPDGSDPGFSDIPAGAWYEADVARLAASSITSGCGDGTRFCPNQDTTRAQMATFLTRARQFRQELPEDEVLGIVDAEAYMVRLVNQLRSNLSVPGLVPHSGVATVARAWSNEMADAGEFQHNPLYFSQYPDGATAGGENIAEIPYTGNLDVAVVRRAFEGLKNSPGHYANMISAQYNRIGVGVADTGDTAYFTQNFAHYTSSAQTQQDGDPNAGSVTSATEGADEQTIQLSSDPDGDTFTYLGTPDSGASTITQMRGDFSVPMFLCGPTSYFDAQYMTELLDILNSEVASVFNQQSSGLVDVTFEAGAVVSPDVPWDTSHNLFDDPYSNPCMDSARAISGSRQILVVAYDRSHLGCKGYSSPSWSFLRVNPWKRTPAGVAGIMHLQALYGTAYFVLGLRPLEPYGHAGLFSYAVAEDQILVSPGGPLRTEDVPIVLSCYRRERLGWPVDDGSPLCHRMTPAGSTVSVVPGEHTVSVTWTEPTHSDGVPVIGYALRLYQHESVAFSRFSRDRLSLQPTLVAQEEFSLNEGAYVFENLDPSKSYTIELDLRSRYGRTIVGSDLFRVMTTADTIDVTDVEPFGFTLSWNPVVEGATRYMSSVDYSYFTTTQHSLYGFTGLLRELKIFSYGVRDESGKVYYTLDSSQHLQGQLLPWNSFGSAIQTRLEGRWPRPAGFNDSQPHGTRFGANQGIRPNTTYTIRIMACRDDGDAIRSESCHDYAIVPVVTPAAPVLSPPSQVSADPGNTWVDLTWQSVPGVGIYEICGFYPLCIQRFADRSILESTHLMEERIIGLEPDTTYVFEVKSCVTADSVGLVSSESGADYYCGRPVSSSVTTTTSQAGVAPSRPDEVTATPGDTWIKLEWDDVADADEYRITRYKADGRIDVIVGMYVEEDGQARWIRYHSLKPETDYDFEIQACRTVGSTNACSVPRAVSVMTAPEPNIRPAPPDSPSEFTAVDIFDTWLSAEWNPVPGVEQYRLSINGNPYAYGDYDVSTLPSRDPHGRFWNLNPNTTYTIGVSVCRIVGVSFVCSADATLTVTTKAG